MKKVMLIICLPILCFATEYTVVKGDCLWNIAKRFYNNPFLWKKIYIANQQKIKNPDLIYPGQVFILPDVELDSENITKEVDERINEEETYVSKEDIEEPIMLGEESEGKEEHIEVYEKETQKKYGNYKERFVRTIKLKNFKVYGQITAGVKKKFVYIDFDKVYCELKEDIEIPCGKILGVYHLGPSKYDINLMKVPKDQLTLVGKLRVIKILKDRKILCEIIRAYSPIVIGDFITLPKN